VCARRVFLFANDVTKPNIVEEVSFSSATAEAVVVLLALNHHILFDLLFFFSPFTPKYQSAFLMERTLNLPPDIILKADG
jgi:hypothetical protein